MTENPNLTVALDQKQIEELEKSGPPVLKQAQEFEIDTQEDYEASGSFLQALDARKRKVVDFFAKPAAQANELHKFITGLRNRLAGPYIKAETIIKERRGLWREKAAAADRERERIERAKAKEDAEAQALEEAKQLVEIGEREAADTVIQRAVDAPPPPVFVPSSVPKQAGLGIRRVWKWRLKNQDLIKDEFWIPDETKINAVVSRLGEDATSIVGGIEVYQEEIESVRKR